MCVWKNIKTKPEWCVDARTKPKIKESMKNTVDVALISVTHHQQQKQQPVIQFFKAHIFILWNFAELLSFYNGVWMGKMSKNNKNIKQIQQI